MCGRNCFIYNGLSIFNRKLFYKINKILLCKIGSLAINGHSYRNS